MSAGNLDPCPNVGLELGHRVDEALGPADVQHRSGRPFLPHADTIVEQQQLGEAVGILLGVGFVIGFGIVFGIGVGFAIGIGEG